MDKYGRWKNPVEAKGLTVKVDKRKGVQLLFGKKSSVSKVDFCGICGEGVGSNSILCTECQMCVHCCCYVPRQVSLLQRWNVIVCRTYVGHNYLVEENLQSEKGENVLEEVEKFCYLGDMISCYGGASETVSGRIGSVWKKFSEFSDVLVGKQGLSLKQWGKIYQCYTFFFL